MKKMQCIFVVVFIVCMAWQTVFAQEKGSPQEWFQKGAALENQQVYEEAIDMYTRAIALDDNYVDAYLRRGHAHWVSRPTDFKTSMADFDKAIAIDPKNAEAYYQRGLLHAFLIYNENARTDMIAAAGLGHEGAKKWLTSYALEIEAKLQAEMKKEAEGKGEATAAEQKWSEGQATEQKLADLREYLPSKSEPMVHFAFDKSEIKEDYYAVLDEVAVVLKDKLPAVKILVSGHTCSIGREAYNEALSLARADAVKSYLESKHGISPDRIITKGYGLNNPIDTNETKEGRARNRRAQIQIAE